MGSHYFSLKNKWVPQRVNQRKTLENGKYNRKTQKINNLKIKLSIIYKQYFAPIIAK